MNAVNGCESLILGTWGSSRSTILSCSPLHVSENALLSVSLLIVHILFPSIQYSSESTVGKMRWNKKRPSTLSSAGSFYTVPFTSLRHGAAHRASGASVALIGCFGLISFLVQAGGGTNEAVIFIDCTSYVLLSGHRNIFTSLKSYFLKVSYCGYNRRWFRGHVTNSFNSPLISLSLKSLIKYLGEEKIHWLSQD